MTRVLDVVVSLFLIVLLLPVLAPTALALSFCQHGPVIRRRPSAGTAPVYCFNTDIAAASMRRRGLACAFCDFVERSRLATLPEFLSVLRGDLTIFGDLRLRPVLLGGPDFAAS